MSRRLACLVLLAVTNLSAFAVAEAASGVEGAEPGALVAVLDTGVSLDAGDRVLPGIDLVAPDADAADENGHGTAVAATIAATCGGCRILPVRVLSKSGGAPWSRVAAGIVWAVDHGARVVNVSIAGPGGSRALRAAVAYAAARNVLVVASAGNRGDAVRQYPAAYREVVAVAATGAAGKLQEWSSRGAWVDLAAPGCEELHQPEGDRTWACGTSFAAPLVSGLAGRVFGEQPRATTGAVTRSLEARVAATAAPEARLRVAGRPLPGATLRASLAGEHGLGERVRWFRCAVTGSPHQCVPVSEGSSYRVRAADRGWTLVARAVTKPFGGLWVASSRRLAV